AIILEPVSFFGLDIGDTQARVIQLNQTSEKASLVAAGSIAIDAAKAKSDNPADWQAVSDKIRQLLEEVGIITEQVVFSMPEADVFSRIIELPRMSSEEASQAIEYEAESYVPYPLDEVQLDWQILDEEQEENQDEDKMRVFLAAAPLNQVERLVGIVEGAGLKPLAIETDTIASNRSLTNESQKSGCVAIIDMGLNNTALSISNQGLIRLTHNIPLGGKHISIAIAKDLGIDEVAADKLKLGLSKLDDVQKNTIRKVYNQTLDTIVVDIKRSMDFFIGQSYSTKIEKAILCGGGARLEGIVDYFSTSLGLPVELADPWMYINCADALSSQQLQQMATVFPVAIGLAMRKEK
ncbi:MAG TPA: type IV pilus assembly protein PilM, partial [Candidatus Wirthbacteria bacterium]|nr:type IV pilus assembly protein PilM [Candidatus Wirthbacteria bacterium]